MGNIIKYDKCGKIKKSKKIAWTNGSLRRDDILFDDKNYIGYFDLCPKCAKPFGNTP